MTLVYLWNTNENAFDEIWFLSIDSYTTTTSKSS